VVIDHAGHGSDSDTGAPGDSANRYRHRHTSCARNWLFMNRFTKPLYHSNNFTQAL
jgi:hypothetical protein